jgi:hypothetical protein
MKKLLILLLSVAALAVRLPAQPAADRFAGLKAKIESLLNPRLEPAPLPDTPANPFQFIVTGLPANLPDTVAAQPMPTTLSDEQILAYAVARLRISGLVERGGVTHLLINSASYKEADLVPLRTSGDTVYYIRLVRIADGMVTFGYNNHALTVKLPN